MDEDTYYVNLEHFNKPVPLFKTLTCEYLMNVLKELGSLPYTNEYYTFRTNVGEITFKPYRII